MCASFVQFPHLFSPFTIRGVTLGNRIMSTGHETGIVDRTGINDALVAYHRARAAGGAGLIVIEVASVHLSATLCAIPSSSIATMPSRATGASPAPPMPRSLVHDVISGFGDAARRLQRAEVDGCEILCSMGYLLAQFLNPRVNLRTDEYGGSAQKRLRIVREILHNIRAKVGDDMVVGIRISGDELSPEELSAEEVLTICAALDDEAGLDYFNVIAGTSTSLSVRN